LVSVVGELALPYTTSSPIDLMYLMATLFMAVRHGLWPSLITAAVSVLAFDFLFVPPVYSLRVSAPTDVLTLGFFAVVAVTAASLASRLRAQMLVARHHAETEAELYRFAATLAATVTVDALISEIVAEVGKTTGYAAEVSLATAAPARATGVSLPLRAANEVVAVMTVGIPEGRVIADRERRLLGTLAELAGMAIGRQLLADKLARLGIEQEADRLRSALLSSIAHDLTAPISSLASALGSLDRDYQTFDEAERRALIGEAEQQADHLHRFSANLVDITRLEAGVIRLRREMIDIGDLVGSALSRARRILRSRRVIIGIPPGLRAELDIVLMEHTVFNLLENAVKYSPADSTVTIAAKTTTDGIAICVTDEGPGLAPDEAERIFEKFYRGRNASAAVTPGTGLGLSICRGFVEAHGGRITARNRADRSGACFTILLPAVSAGVASGL
jgi:two-component system sensor histidine kinase KdpD